MVLSSDCVVVFVLRDSGVRGSLASGRIEPLPDMTLNIYNSHGVLNEYISGARLRSWRVFSHGTPLPDWSHVMPEDAEALAKQV